MKILLIASLLLTPLAQASAHDRGGGGRHGVSFGLGLGLHVAPQLARIPGHAVFYAPGVSANLFFHDGLYWGFDDDGWHWSARHDGPWAYVAPQSVPTLVLQVPVRYYQRPPAFFLGWRGDHAPRWDDHWGRGWDRHRDHDLRHRSHAPGRHGGHDDRRDDHRGGRHDDDRRGDRGHDDRDDDRRGGGHGRGGRR